MSTCDYSSASRAKGSLLLSPLAETAGTYLSAIGGTAGYNGVGAFQVFPPPPPPAQDFTTFPWQFNYTHLHSCVERGAKEVKFICKNVENRTQ